MKLHELNIIPKFKNLILRTQKLLTCGYSRVYEFDYQGDEVTDTRPKVVSLGRWKSPKGNNLLAGINLNYLSDEQINRLQRNLQSILRDRNLRRRVRKLRSLMPDIFHASYRTYYRDGMQEILPSTLRFISVPKDPEKVDTAVSTDVPRPDSAPNSSIDADDVEAPQYDPELAAGKTPEDEPMRDVDLAEPEPEEIEQPEEIEEPEEPEDIEPEEPEEEELEDNL